MATRVLIVDDAPFMRDMLRDILLPPDFDVVGEAEHGVEAVEKYRQLTPDLVTMDVVMPYKSGIEATQEIMQVDPKAMIVMCSALGQDTLVSEALEKGAIDFIVKPFRADDVRAILKKVLLQKK
jgi:two-component system, chemotaxis family, chemotaxis protein CheY